MKLDFDLILFQTANFGFEKAVLALSRLVMAAVLISSGCKFAAAKTGSAFY